MWRRNSSTRQDDALRANQKLDGEVGRRPATTEKYERGIEFPLERHYPEYGAFPEELSS